MKSIKRAIKYFGGNIKMANAMGIRADYVYKWSKEKRFPSVRHALAIEEATKGKITAEEILIEKAKLQLKIRMKKLKKEKD